MVRLKDPAPSDPQVPPHVLTDVRQARSSHQAVLADKARETSQPCPKSQHSCPSGPHYNTPLITTSSEPLTVTSTKHSPGSLTLALAGTSARSTHPLPAVPQQVNIPLQDQEPRLG